MPPIGPLKMRSANFRVFLWITVACEILLAILIEIARRGVRMCARIRPKRLIAGAVRVHRGAILGMLRQPGDEHFLIRRVEGVSTIADG